MHLPGSLNQTGTDRSYRADGAIANTSPKLIIPQAISRSLLSVQNTGLNAIYMEHGCARATATLTGGVVTAINILNAGFGFVKAPNVQFKGGGGQYLSALTSSNWDGRGQIDNWPTPAGYNTLVSPPINSRVAKAVAILTSGVVTSFLIQDGGAGYINPPEVLLTNDPLDPYGCADPSVGGGSGVPLLSGSTYYLNGTVCHTNAIAMFAAAGSGTYYLEYAP